MGIAVLSGVIDSLDSGSRIFNGLSKWESHTPGTVTPVGHPDETLPARFIACVNREESAVKLRKIFGALGNLGEKVEVVASQNLKAVQEADVVLLWYVSRCEQSLASYRHFISCKPQLAHSILGEEGLKEALDGKLLISILAGVTMSQIIGWVLPSTKVIRAMPNTPCKVGPSNFHRHDISPDNAYVLIDPRGDDRSLHHPVLPRFRNRPRYHPQDLLLYRSVPFP